MIIKREIRDWTTEPARPMPRFVWILGAPDDIPDAPKELTESEDIHLWDRWAKASVVVSASTSICGGLELVSPSCAITSAAKSSPRRQGLRSRSEVPRKSMTVRMSSAAMAARSASLALTCWPER